MPRKRAKPSEILAASQVEAKRFDLSELAHVMVEKCGGLEVFAADYVAEMKAARPGSVARYKLAAGIMTIIMHAAEKAKPQTEAGNLTDEELHQTLLAELTRRGIVVEEGQADGDARTDLESGAIPPDGPGGLGLRAA